MAELRFRLSPTFLILTIPFLAGVLHAQGTKLWSVSRYEEFEKGTAQGVAIRSDGRLETAAAVTAVRTTDSAYVWSVAADSAGNAYLGTGSPASVEKVGADGKPQTLFAAKELSGELAVQVVRVGPDGAVYAATLLGAKVYKLDSKGGAPVVVFDAEKADGKPKYIWDMTFDKTGRLYVATGGAANGAAIYRVDGKQTGSAAEVFFQSEEQHIRCMRWLADGNLIAGTDGHGLVYRISPEGKGFVLYQAAKREITSLAVDGAGDVYAAAVGEKHAPNLPPLPVQGGAGATVSISFAQPGSILSSGGAGGSALIPDGSEIYKITATGAPRKLWASKDDVVYGLDWHGGALLAATGNRGHIYKIEDDGQFADVAHLEASQATAFAGSTKGLYVATSNTGRLYRVADAMAADGTSKDASLTSEVFDSGVFSRWGRVEVLGSGKYSLAVRTGNTENPGAGWSEWKPAAAGAAPAVPGARFAQWKVTLGAGGRVNSVAWNYLGENQAPVVEAVVVQAGARVNAVPQNPQAAVVNVTFPSSGQNGLIALPQDAAGAAGPLIAQKDKTAITVRWLAQDENGDDLTFSVYFRGDGEEKWRLLKDKITERYLSFDAAALPDGGYVLKVVASDAASHTPGEALTGAKESERFEVDTTPPVPGELVAKVEGKTIHATLEATDAQSPIGHAEYSLDAGPWQYLEPAGKLSDAKAERYEFNVDLTKAAKSDDADAAKSEHVLAVRVYDRFENMSSVKTVVR